MKYINLLLSILLFTISCSSIPKLVEDPAAQMSCGLPFPKGNWQFIHSIEATMPGGDRLCNRDNGYFIRS